MSSLPRPFQVATVEAAVAALTGSGSRRFLVADEVGLGKTTVAREVVKRLSAGGSKRLTVYYITNNTRVSDQNASRLVDFLGDKAARAPALSSVDRLALIPLDVQPVKGSPHSPLRVYSLAPQTSFPPETARPTPGAAVERAFLGLLLEKAVPGVSALLPPGFIQQRAQVCWDGACQTAAKAIDRVPKLVLAYRRALKARFDPEGRLARLARRIAEAAAGKSATRTLTILRRLLAEACLEATPPDLIIFDEFQRFRELLHPAEGDRLGRTLLGDGARKRPAMLLLSATPYRLYGDSWDGKKGPQAHEELYETIEFLTLSPALRERAEELFASFGEILRTIGDDEADDIDPTLERRARATRDEIEALLRPCIARTERPAGLSQDHRTIRTPLPVTPSDLRTFKHFASNVSDRNRTAAAAYWLSVPLPAQALGSRYKIAENVEFEKASYIPALRINRRASGGKNGWGSPKLRALQAVAKPADLALPWVAPSIHWWPLAGPWTHAPTQKTLLFSRFRATPQSVAALLSAEVEDAYLGKIKTPRRRQWESKRLAPKSGLPVMALFHPSPWLVRVTDPLAGNCTTAHVALRTVASQLRTELKTLGISVRSKPKKDAKRARPLWNLLAAIERRSKDYALTQKAWLKAASNEAVLGRILIERDQVDAFSADPTHGAWLSVEELRRLAELALASPAIAVARAWYRHFPAAIAAKHIDQLVWFCWHRLRPYLDNRVFWGRLGSGNPTEVLLAAVRDGGLESALDEHFWLAQGQTDAANLLDELGSALHASLGWFTFRALPTSEGTIRLRCHAAVPFSGTDAVDAESTQLALSEADSETPPRVEALRRAFNTPFWPHVLATTSIGQEGLDFHSWCRRIVHWDLPSTPIDLEQREGRIVRYGGLMVRRPLGVEVDRHAVLSAGEGQSPWTVAAALAEQRYPSETGLSPWWTFESAGKSADVERHVLALSKSRDIPRFDHLQRQRLLYRLALGQPNQEDLVNHLARGSDQKISAMSRLALDLRPRCNSTQLGNPAREDHDHGN